MRTARRPSKLADLRFGAALAVGAWSAAYVMGCARPTALTDTGPSGQLAIVTTSPLPNGTVGNGYCIEGGCAGLPPGIYGFQFTAKGGNPPKGGYTWSHPSGSASDTLPTGLTLSSFGLLAGVSTDVGTCTFTVEVSDGIGTRRATFTVTINPLVPLSITTPSTLPNGSVGTPYSSQFQASGGVEVLGYSWSHVDNPSKGDTLPTGLVMSRPAGKVAGTPKYSGSSTFTVSVTDEEFTPATVTGSFTITVAAAPSPPVLVLAQNPLTFTANPTMGPGPQNELVTSTGGTASGLSMATTYAPGATGWINVLSISAGATPATIQVGLPPAVGNFAAGSYSATVTISSTTPGVVPIGLTVNLDVTPPPPVTISTTSLPPGTVGLAYNNPLMATGGLGAYDWSVTSGSVPTGLVLNRDGTWSGVPTTTVGSPFGFTVQAASGTATPDSKAYSVTIQPGCAITPSGTLTAGTAGVAYSLGLAAGGTCTLPGNWGITNSPPGLSLAGQVVASTTETLEGTPTTAGRYLFTIGFSDAAATTTAFDTIFVQPAPNTCAIVPVAVPDGTVGTPYGDGTNNVLTATNECTTASDPAQWTWSVSGAPPGLSLVQGPSQTTPTATLQGTPTTANAPSPYAVVVTFRNGPSDPGVSQFYTINITPAPAADRVRPPMRAPARAGRSP